MIKQNGLLLTHIEKSFQNQKILTDLSLTVKKGEIVSLLGKSGVGKTTVFNLIAGLSLPDQGDIFWKGHSIKGKTGLFSYMLQKDLLLPYKTIFQNLMLPLLIKKIPKKKAQQTVKEGLDYFQLTSTMHCYPAQLSGGMRQRIALLRTYLFSKECMLLDEPFSALDSLTKASLYQWFLTIQQQHHISTLFITHDINEALLLSHRIYILGDRPGRIVKEIILPQKPESFEFTPEFLTYKKEIMLYLK